MNEKGLVTAKDAESILNSWAELKTHRPIREYQLHEVTIRVNNGTLTFICEDYIIRDEIAMFSNVRQQKTYGDSVTRIVPEFFMFCDNGADHWAYHTFKPHLITANCCDFSVLGYVVMGDKTAHSKDIVDINSYVTEPQDTWYVRDEDLASIMSTNKIVEHNSKVIERNKKTLANHDAIDKFILQWEDNFAWHNYNFKDKERGKAIRAIDDEFDKNVEKYKPKWIGKLLVKKPAYPPLVEKPLKLPHPPISEEAKAKYLKELNKLRVSLADGIDTTYLVNAICGENTVITTTVEDADFTEVE